MTIVAMTREMGSLGKDVAAGLGDALGLPVIYHEVIDQLADRMRVRKSHVIRWLDGRAGLLERLTADKTSLFIHSADEILSAALEGRGAVIRGWGATHLLRDVAHVVCVRICAPFELRKRRMMVRLATREEGKVADEIRLNDEAHTAIMRRHFGLQWTEPEHYDLVLNTERIGVEQCVDEVLRLARSPEFEETEDSRAHLRDLALASHVRAALRRAPETRDLHPQVSASEGRVWLGGCTERELLALVEVVSAVPGVRDVAYRARPDDAPAQKPH